MLRFLLTYQIISFFIFCIDGNIQLHPTQKYLELNSSESFQLTCIGPSKKEWDYPRKQLQHSSKGRAEIPVSNVIIEQSAEDSDKTILKVQNSRYSDTGAYQCLSGNGTNFESVGIYVYVRDEDHLLVDAKTNLYAHEFSNFTIPCKPTARDVTVKLMRKIRRKMIEFVAGNKTQFTAFPVEYHIEEGFILPFVTWEVKGEFMCIGKRGEKEQEVLFIVTFVPGFKGSLNMPHIVPSKTFLVVGDNVELDCTLLESGVIDISTEWDVPEKVKDYKRENNREIIENETLVRYHNRLVLKNVEMEHEGDYTCTVMDPSHNINKAKYHLKVHPKFTTFLNLSSHEAPVKIVAPSTNEQRITVRIDANPRVDKMDWYFTNREQRSSQIFDNRKYKNESFHENYASLILKFPDINDSGIYRFSASNGEKSSFIDIYLLVEAMPEIIEPLNPLCENILVNSGSYLFQYKTQHEISCLSIGYPKPTVSWYFQEFSTFPSLSGDDRLKIHSSNYKNIKSNASFDITTDSRLEGLSLKSGVIYCKSCNIFGCREASMRFLVTDIKMGFDTWVEYHNMSQYLISGDNGTIHCGASKFEYGPALEWSYRTSSPHSQQHDLIHLNDSNIFITNKETELSYLSTIVIKNVTTNLTGLYTCEAETFSKKKRQSAISIKVESSSFPVFLNTTSLNNGTRRVENDASLELSCDAAGLPKPRIVWYYNNKEITALLETRSIDKGRISLIDGNSKLKILHATEAETGNYTCKAINRLGSVLAHSTLIVAAVNSLWPWIIFSTILIIVILSVIIIILYQRVRHEKALLRELTKTVLETFDDGAEGDLNPELGIVEQADLLPYKKQYEFPRENLKLGKQLGSGAFGVVLKAEANGIVKDSEVTTVAVKMLKQNVDVSHIKALTTELKVMIHLGKHLNVVNLLGACTRNLNNRELLVIVEYCKYGNLHDYLRRNRNNFINQINPKTGLFDSNLIGTRITETERKRLFPSQSTSSYTGATHSDSSVTFYSNCTVMTDFYSNQQDPSSRLVHNYKNLAVDPMDEEDDDYIVSKDLLPALKPQIKGEHEFCTEDLLCWGFQTACGMEYLASRKVLHGDLAARNILLAENNVIKICDFGMSKNMNYDDNYCKKGKQLLPVKWLSIEAMRDREFSVYSDIWSFGVVLWEFFSLARTPYPGIEGVQELYKKLESGFRMERPAFSPDIVYRIMLECWNEEPKRRPSFTDLAARLGYMIDRDVQKHFLNLSEQLTKSNEEDYDENDCLIQPSNVEYQNLVTKDIESSTTKDDKAAKKFELLELKPMPQNGVVSEIDRCGFSNQTYGNVDLEQNIPSVNVQLV